MHHLVIDCLAVASVVAGAVAVVAHRGGAVREAVPAVDVTLVMIDAILEILIRGATSHEINHIIDDTATKSS